MKKTLNERQNHDHEIWEEGSLEYLRNLISHYQERLYQHKKD